MKVETGVELIEGGRKGTKRESAKTRMGMREMEHAKTYTIAGFITELGKGRKQTICTESRGRGKPKPDLNLTLSYNTHEEGIFENKKIRGGIKAKS